MAGRLAAWAVAFGGFVLLIVLCLMTTWKKEKYRWWEDQEASDE